MISIVIPTYNEAAVIEETLRRVAATLRSVSQDFELVVVDDASADGTAERAESLATEIPVFVLRRPSRLGLATAVLDGWALARDSDAHIQAAKRFAIESERLRMLILATPAGLEGWFKELSVPAPAMTLPPPAETPYSEIQKMLAAAPKYGLEFVLPKK